MFASRALQAPPQTDLTGSSLGRYRVLERVGAGGMGEVYRAHDERLDRDVAVKLLPATAVAEEAGRTQLRSEALALSRLDHPAVATVYDLETSGDLHFLVTEYIPGEDLAQKVGRGALPSNELLELALQLVEGLAAAHAQGVVHRDLKPANLRVTPDGRLKILDFGLAHVPPPASLGPSDTTAESDPMIAGTIRYMAPEQLRGETVDPRSDLYAVGAVLYEMGTGRPVFGETSTARLIDSILNDAPLAPGRLQPDLPPQLEEIILRCLAKHPEHRYQSAADLLADLRRAVVAGPRGERSLAVLYFENLGGNVEDQYFRDGITEDITTELARIKDLHVFSRSAVLAFRDRPVTPYYVGQQLGAAYVLEGSLRREGERLRITAGLVQTRSGHTLWAERFDRRLDDVFAVQDEIANSIAGALRVVLTQRERQAIRKVPTTDFRAYDFYLRGRHFFLQFRRRGLDLGREMFASAIAIDPAFARAYAGVAYCCAFLYMFWDSSPENLEQAESASTRALALDPELSEAHTARGVTASLRKDYTLAQREFQTAMGLDPKSFEPYYFTGRNAYVQGRLAEAVQWFEQAAHVLPEDYQASMLRASALHGLGRQEEARHAYREGLAAAEKHLEVNPEDARAYYFGANALTQIGDRERALRWAERALRLEPDEHQVLYNVACVYALLGEAERALDCLARSLTRGWAQRQWMEHDPDLASLRELPRFQELLRGPGDLSVSPAAG